MKPDRFYEISKDFSGKKIVVFGDLMLDTYFWGRAERISPEAPVPVVRVDRIQHNPGGAANVAWNLASLGAQVEVVGLTGKDAEGSILQSMLQKRNIGCKGVITDEQRPTTVKSRIIAHGQQVVRADRENTDLPSREIQDQLEASFSNLLDSANGIILQDYNKGVLNKQSIPVLIETARKAGIPVYVDPKKENFTVYKKVRLFKPNLNEFRTAYAVKDDLLEAGMALRSEIEAELVLITRGEEGLSLFMKDGHHHIPTRARNVHDVSGAGDTVISTFVLADLSGADPQEAATLANYAAGRVCEEVGVVPINLEMLAEMINHHYGK
jgi:rfaE bifunctional protein kinase chain/domain